MHVHQTRAENERKREQEELLQKKVEGKSILKSKRAAVARGTVVEAKDGDKVCVCDVCVCAYACTCVSV